MYFDLETTAPTEIFLIQNKKKKVFCFNICFNNYFLSSPQFIIQRSFAHSLEELSTINYLNNNQMKFIDLQILNQLNDIAIDVSKRKCENTTG